MSAAVRTAAFVLAASFTACSLGFGEGFSGGPAPDDAGVEATTGGDGSPAQVDATSDAPGASDSGDGAAPSFDPDLVGFWRLDETTGTVAKDSTPLGNDGKLVGGAVFTPGRVGGAALFNGTSANVEIAAHPSLAITNKITIALWARLDDAALTNWRLFAYGFQVGVKLNGGRRPQFSGNAHYANTLTPIAVGEWHHLAFTFDTGAVAIYYDGFSVALAENTFVASDTFSLGAAPVRIGSDGDGLNGIIGALDEVRLYRRVLTPPEIAALLQ